MYKISLGYWGLDIDMNFMAKEYIVLLEKKTILHVKINHQK